MFRVKNHMEGPFNALFSTVTAKIAATAGHHQMRYARRGPDRRDEKPSARGGSFGLHFLDIGYEHSPAQGYALGGVAKIR